MDFVHLNVLTDSFFAYCLHFSEAAEENLAAHRLQLFCASFHIIHSDKSEKKLTQASENLIRAFTLSQCKKRLCY